MEPVLFYGAPQGCSLGSIVALEWLGRPYRLSRIEMLQHPWPAAFARVNVQNQTPALITGECRALSESTAILLHIAHLLHADGKGPAPGTAAWDRAAEALAFLATDFFAAFSPLWKAYEMDSPTPETVKLLRELGEEDVRKRFGAIERRLARREWMAGSERSIADAYFAGVVRWAEYHQLFDIAREFPATARLVAKLRDDPAVRFAADVEKGKAAVSGAFLGHLTVDEAVQRLAA